ILLLTSVILIRPPPSSTLFPYTTLFRSSRNTYRNTTRHIIFYIVIYSAFGCPATSFYFVAFACDLNLLAVTITSKTGVVKRDEVDRKSTRLNSSHVKISYAVFCLKKKKK